MVKAFRELGHEVYPYAKYYQQNRWVEGYPKQPHGDMMALDAHEWDLILFMECNDGDPQYPELKVTRARQTAGWFFDTSYHADRYKKLVDFFRFDHLFLANPLTIQEYKLWDYKNVHYLPYACDRELHGRSLECPKTRDVVLVGSDRPDRRALVDALAGHGVDLQLISGVFREEYIDALASARIVVNQNPNVGRGLLNMRFWEAQAAGSIVFTEMADMEVNPPRYICNLVPYREPKDIVSSYQEILAGNQENIAATIQRGQEMLFEHHTYQNRCETILEKMFPHG